MIRTKLIVIAISLVITLAGIFSFWKHADQNGFDRGYQEQQVRIDTLVSKISVKIDDIESTSNKLAVDAKIRDEVLATDIGTIIARTKGKTFTIIKNGECTPSSTFSDTINELNKRANQTMKESQK